MKKEKAKMEENKSKKLIKILKIVSIIFGLILIAECFYLVVLYKNRESKTIYANMTSGMIQEKDSFYAVGSSDFKNSSIGYQKGYQKARFAKYSKNGKLIFEKAYLDGYSSVYNDVAKVGKNYIAVGQYRKTKTNQKENTGPAILVKYSEDGKVLLKKEELILDDTKFTKVKALKDGGYLVVGQSIFENMTLGTDDRGGAIIIRYDKDDKELWRANYGGSKSGIFQDVYVDEEEKVIYAVGKDASRTGMLVKYNFDGERIFTKNYSYTDTIGFTSIEKLNDDFIIGSSKKISEDRDDYKTEALLLKYDKDGNLLFEKTYKKNEMSRFNDIVIIDNKIYAVGHSAILNKEKTTKALRSFDYSGIYVCYKEDGSIIKSSEYKEKNASIYFSSLLKEGDNLLVSGQGSAKLFKSNQKDTRSFLIELNRQGKKLKQLY